MFAYSLPPSNFSTDAITLLMKGVNVTSGKVSLYFLLVQ
jgi:hypothetical protein